MLLSVGLDADFGRFIEDSWLVALNRANLGTEIPHPVPSYLAYYAELFAWTEAVVSARDLAAALLPVTKDVSLALSEELVSLQRRKRLGEHYTPGELVDYVLAHTFRGDHPDSVLDPAVGGGAFLRGFIRHCVSRRLSGASSFTGYDLSPSSLAIAGLNAHAELASLPIRPPVIVKLELKDTLKAVGEAQGLFGSGSFGFVVGNPPYVRVQRIPEHLRDLYRRNYGETATGRFDLYMLFVDAASRLLRETGRLGYVLSNKLLTTAAGLGTRRHLASHYSVVSILDLADSKLFQASVLPMVLIATRSEAGTTSMRYTVVRERTDPQAIYTENLLANVSDLEGRLDEAVGTYRVHAGVGAPRSFHVHSFNADVPRVDARRWHFASPAADEVIAKLRSLGTALSLRCEAISAGIKTTADDVFFRPVTREFLEHWNLERESVKPFVQGLNVERWRINWTGTHAGRDTYLIYPHREVEGRTQPIDLEEIPSIARWLCRPENRERLEARRYVAAAGRRWYEIWVPQRPSLFERRFKIVTADISPRNNFALDEFGRWCGGSAFMVIPRAQTREEALFLLGVLNSRALEFFHKLASSTFIYSGRYRYGASAIRDYPIPQASVDERCTVVNLVAELLREPVQADVERQLNEVVEDIFQLTAAQRDEIARSLGELELAAGE